MRQQQVDWAGEFKEFLETPPVTPPLGVTHEIISRVRCELSPSTLVIFLKVGLSAAFSGALSLFLCPQFGFGDSGHSAVHHLFMGLGSVGCALACGAFFSVIGVVVAALFVRPEELRLVRSNKALLISALSALSLSAFVCLGASVFLESALVWFIGSLIGGCIGVEAVSTVVFRSRPVRY